MNKIYVNKKQETFLAATQRIKTFQAGRGTGKTTLVGDELYENIRAMPRAKGFILGKTFGQVYTKFLPEILDRLLKYGIKEHIDHRDPGHYVVCKKPPAWYAKPYKIPRSYDNVITFWNGYSKEMLSFDRPDLGRGGSYDDGDIDEAALIDYTVFTQTILPLLRGNKSLFKSPRRFGLRIYSSMPWKTSGKWVVHKMKQLAAEHPDQYFFLQSSARDNVDVLGEEYFQRMQGLMDPLTYAVEIDNQEINKIPDSFYSYLSESDHLYSPDYAYNYGDDETWDIKKRDINPELPIDPSFDFNAKFSSASIWQDLGQELRAIRVEWVTYDLVESLVDQICTSFADHPTKVANIYGGKDGHTRRDLISQYTYFQIIENRFRANGWEATIQVTSSEVDGAHKLTHSIVNNVLRGDDPSLPAIRINESEAKQLFISMSQAPIRDDFKKNKKSELDTNLPQEYATHLSDTFDNYVVPKCSNRATAGSSPWATTSVG
jgi:hypothetical protein